MMTMIYSTKHAGPQEYIVVLDTEVEDKIKSGEWRKSPLAEESNADELKIVREKLKQKKKELEDIKQG